jgi:Uma2 family endonuclease
MATGLARKTWSVEEYEEMIEKGILDKNDHVELIRGEIVNMTPIGMRHAACVTILSSLFYELVGAKATVSVQNPVLLLNHSEPQPDIALLRDHPRAYVRRRPTSTDIILLVEVSDTTLKTDRTIKVPLYAEAGVPEVWIVNLEEDVIEVYTQPEGSQYGEMHSVGRGGTVNLPGGLPGSVRVDEVLG